MVEEVCSLLQLNIQAGLGRRLAEAEVRQDSENPNLFYIFQDDVVEASSLAYALSVLAKEVLHLENMQFKPASPRFTSCLIGDKVDDISFI